MPTTNVKDSTQPQNPNPQTATSAATGTGASNPKDADQRHPHDLVGGVDPLNPPPSAMPGTMLVRIKPNNRRESHTIIYDGKSYPFTKERGWHQVPSVVAQIAAAEVMSDLGPDSPNVFDVKDVDAATRQVAAENLREDPAGTPERPHVVRPTELPGTVQSARDDLLERADITGSRNRRPR